MIRSQRPNALVLLIALCMLVFVSQVSCKSLKVAVYQGDIVFGNKLANIATLSNFTSQAKADGYELVVFPELFLTGYYPPSSTPEALAMVEPLNGIHISMVKHIAQTKKVAIVMGYAEVAIESSGIKLYNSAVFIDDNGVVRKNFRKVHLTSADTAFFARGNNAFSVFDYKNFTIGLTICQDLGVPETARELAALGAEVIANPAAISLPPEINFSSNVSFRSRAYDNGVFVLHSNPVASYGGFLHYTGLSRIVDTLGRDMVEVDATPGVSKLLYATLTIDETTYTSEDALALRVPGYYPNSCV